jgi:hypothetical protein
LDKFEQEQKRSNRVNKTTALEKWRIFIPNALEELLKQILKTRKKQ